MPPLRVYLSSTYVDLQEYRQAVFTALERAGLNVARMEGYSAADERPLDMCLADVARCDVYVGLFAWRYGYVPPAHHGNPEGRSITELEYRHATRQRCLVFFAHPDTESSWPERFRDAITGEGDRGRRLQALREDLGTERSVAFFRSPEELATQVLAAIMRAGVSGRPYNVPPRLAKYVPRQALTTAVADSVIRGGGPGTNTIVHGGGGFGKTTLLLDVCHRPETVNVFSNGILWASLGEKPDVATTLASLVAVATGRAPAALDPEGIAGELSTALGGRTYLVVLDDVWRPGDLRRFLQLDGATLLVSTRVRNLAEQAGQRSWPEVAVDEMTPDQACALLADGCEPAAADLAATLAFAERLGCWPLLLELANARLLEERKAGRGDFAACLAWVSALFAGRGVHVFDRRDADSRRTAVEGSVGVALDFADAMFPGLAARAGQLGIFPEDLAIPATALATLWARRPLDVVEDVVRPLDNLSLVQWNRASDDVRVHDMIRLALLSRLPDREAVHGALVDGWGDLRQLPDPYAWRWVGYHLRAAGRADRFRELLLDADWLAAKIAGAGLGSLDADFDALAGDRPLRLVHKAIELSAHVLSRDATQLAGQLCGRLLDQPSPDIQQLLATAARRQGAWLRPLSASLATAGGPLLRTLRGHRSAIHAAAITPDGRRVVSGSGDSTVIIWTMATGVAERVLQGHAEMVSQVVPTPDGRRVLSGSSDASVRVWDVENGDPVFTFRGHPKAITALAVTPDSGLAVSGSDDGTVRVWDLGTGACRHVLDAHTAAVTDVVVTTDGLRAISASEDRTLIVWDLTMGTPIRTLGSRAGRPGEIITLPDGRSGVMVADDGVLRVLAEDSDTELATLPGHADVVDSVAVTSDGRRVVSASRDDSLRVWDVHTGVELQVLRGHANQPTVVRLLPGDRRAISASLDKTIRVWDLDRPDPLFTLDGHEFDIFALAVTADGRRAVSGSSDTTVRVWDLERGRALRTLRGHTQSVRAVAISPDGRSAISGGNDDDIRIWDLEEPGAAAAIEGHVAPVNRIAVSADGRRAVTAAGAQVDVQTRDNTVRVWDVESGRLQWVLQGHSDYVWAVAVTPDGRRAVSGGADKTVRVWDLGEGVELAALPGHTDTIWDLQIAPDGRTAVSGATDHTLIVWDLKRLNRRHVLPGHRDWVIRIAIAADNRTAVSASLDGTLKRWDLTNGEALATFSGHAGAVHTVVFSPDGRLALSGSADKTLRLWDVATGQARATLRGHSAAVADVAISSDGRYAVSGSISGEVIVWDLSTGGPLRTLAGHTQYVSAVFFAERDQILTISHDGTVKRWNLDSADAIATFTGEGPIKSGALAARHTLIAGEYAGRVHFLSVMG